MISASQRQAEALQVIIECADKKENSTAQCCLGISILPFLDQRNCCSGRLYCEGLGIEQDLERGLQYCLMSARQGNQEAQSYLSTPRPPSTLEIFN